MKYTLDDFYNYLKTQKDLIKVTTDKKTAHIHFVEVNPPVNLGFFGTILSKDKEYSLDLTIDDIWRNIETLYTGRLKFPQHLKELIQDTIVFLYPNDTNLELMTDYNDTP